MRSIIAHRGASARHPENTLRAFRAAAAEGADMVELDVRLTADGVPVVLHDHEVGSTTDGAGAVHEMRLSEVKRLDASRGGGEREEIPTLAEALDALTVGVDIELKNLPGEPGFDSPDEGLLLATLDVLDHSAFSGDLLISSFNWLSIERCRALRPDLPTGFLTIGAIDPAAAIRYAAEAGHAYVLPQAPAVLDAGPAIVEAAHAAGLALGTWTVDDVELIARLFSWGVDAVATNDPAAGVAVRDSAED